MTETQALLREAKVNNYRTQIQRTTGQIEDLRDKISTYSDICTYDACEMVRDLADLANAVVLLARAIQDKSIRSIR